MVTNVRMSLLTMSNMDGRCKLHHEGIKQIEIEETLQTVHRDKALSHLSACQWLDIWPKKKLFRLTW